jgi:hypothetical protein
MCYFHDTKAVPSRIDDVNVLQPMLMGGSLPSGELRVLRGAEGPF